MGSGPNVSDVRSGGRGYAVIFSELYSVYYNAVARILTAASQPDVTERELQQIVVDQAFSESTLAILPALRSGKWPLLREDMSSVLFHTPTMPLTLLQKRWLKALLDDSRLKLFGITMPELDGVEPLFTRQDYKVFDQYGDGDPYEDERYIRIFQTLLDAMKRQLPVAITFRNQWGEEQWMCFYPVGMEYSLKDDKFRVLADRCRVGEFNVGRILTCVIYHGGSAWKDRPRQSPLLELTLRVEDGRNALERAMLHFAHFEKRTERTADGNYLLHLKYRRKDEQELVIRVLSFGPFVKAVSPEPFVQKIKEKLISQKSCEL